MNTNVLACIPSLLQLRLVAQGTLHLQHTDQPISCMQVTIKPLFHQAAARIAISCSYWQNFQGSLLRTVGSVRSVKPINFIITDIDVCVCFVSFFVCVCVLSCHDYSCLKLLGTPASRPLIYSCTLVLNHKTSIKSTVVEYQYTNLGAKSQFTNEKTDDFFFD